MLFLQTPTNPGTAFWGPGGGGDDTYTPPNEYYITTALPEDATKRQYQTLNAAMAAAQAAAETQANFRLAEEQVHVWDGSGLATTLAAVGSQVTIWCAGGTILEFAVATSLLTDGTLRIEHVLLDCNTNGATLTTGVAIFVVEQCTGQLDIDSTDTPGVLGNQWFITRSVLDRALFEGTVGDLGGIALEVQDSQITSDPAALVDYSAGVSGCSVGIRRSEILYGGGATIFVNNAGDQLNTAFVDSLLNISGDGTVIMSGGTNGVNWTASRIVINEGEGGAAWTFGNRGLATGLSVEHYITNVGARLPVDGPANAIARSPNYGGCFFKQQTDPQSQWRGDGDVMYMEASLAGAAPQTAIMTSVLDNTDTVFLDPVLKRAVRVQGTIGFNVDAVDDTTVIEFTGIVRVSGAAVTWLVGPTFTALYEDNVGRYTVVNVDVVGQGFQVQVDKTASANDPAVQATIQLIEIPSSPP